MKNDKWGSGPVGVGEIEENMKSHFFIVRGEVICVECVSLKQTVPPPLPFHSAAAGGTRAECEKNVGR